MKFTAFLLALGGLAACAHGLGEGTSAAGITADSRSGASLEAPAPRRHLGNLGRGGIYDN
jgi:hypothetical protein